MRMDRSCCWKGDFSALLRGKVTFLVGRVCLVPVNTALCPVCGCPHDRAIGRRGLALALVGAARPTRDAAVDRTACPLLSWVPQHDCVRVMVGVLQH